MPGQYGPPYRPPSAPGYWPIPRVGYFGGPWQHLRSADVVPRWQNITLVRASDSSNVAPYLRYDISNFPDNCTGPGACGAWLVTGDLNGLSTQDITDTVNDILACGGLPVVTSDHNCYSANSTVDLRKAHKIGAKWVLAQKCWQGTFGFIDRADYQPLTSIGFTSALVSAGGGFTGNTATFRTNPPQVKYRTCVATTATPGEPMYSSTGPDIDTGEIVTVTDDEPRNSTVDQLSGIMVNGGSSITSGTFDTLPGVTLLTTYNGWSLNDAIGYFSSWTGGEYVAVYPDCYTTQDGNTYTVHSGEATFDDGYTGDRVLETITCDPSGTFARTIYTILWAPGGSYTWDVWVQESCSLNNTELTFVQTMYSKAEYGPVDVIYPVKSQIKLALSDPYTSGQCYADLNAAIAAWDMSDDRVYPFRTDEQLANGPLVCYDEVGPQQPDVTRPPTMDDYTQPQNEDLTWPQRSWMDPYNYFWQNPSGGFANVPVAGGGNILNTPIRKGTIIAHNQAGSDPHNWFNAQPMGRVYNDSEERWFWERQGWGQATPAPLPAAAMRWMDHQRAQYDGATSNAPGNLPQAFLRQQSGLVIGAKYVEAKEIWQGVNFARPYGADLFAVDQTTVCCVLSGSSGAQPLVIQKTNLAIAPLASGGLADGDTVMIGGDGVYQLTGLTDNGDGTFNATVGSIVSPIPGDVDIGGGYIGRMRFWGRPPFGVEAVTSAYAGATTTFTFTNPTTYWVTESGSPELAVDLYAATVNSAGSTVPAAVALATDVVITKTGDTTATLAGDYHTAAFMVPHGMAPWTDDNRPKRDFVFLSWTFNPRAAATGYPSPPAFYASTPGCLGINVQQASIGFVPCCPAVVGWVPYVSPLIDSSDDLISNDAPIPASGPVEAFNNQVLQAMPDVFLFDDVFGSCWMGAVETTMQDPFWQVPFVPDCTESFSWQQDDGSGEEDTDTVKFYPAPPLVEALASYPTDGNWSGTDTDPTLPAGVTLAFDTTHNEIPPPYYPLGIPIGDSSGNFGSVARPYGFLLAACANIRSSGRFSGTYSLFVTC